MVERMVIDAEKLKLVVSMSANWWPERTTVTMRHEGVECSFDLEGGASHQLFDQHLDGMRFLLHQRVEQRRLAKLEASTTKIEKKRKKPKPPKMRKERKWGG